MPGMVPADKLALVGGQGEEFDELFLKYMIRHHQGALTMVRDLAADGGGNEPEIGAFTRHVEADQNIEISRMEDLQDARPDAVRFAGPSKATRERAQRLSYAGGRPLICYVGQASSGVALLLDRPDRHVAAHVGHAGQLEQRLQQQLLVGRQVGDDDLEQHVGHPGNDVAGDDGVDLGDRGREFLGAPL